MMSQAFFGAEKEKWADLKDMSRYDYAGAALLAAFMLLLGVFPRPFVVLTAATVLPFPGVS